MTAVVLSLTIITFKYSVSATPASFDERLPVYYSSQSPFVQVFQVVPEFESNNFLYQVYLGPDYYEGLPPALWNPLHVEAAYIEETATPEYEWNGNNWVCIGGTLHMTASHLTFWVADITGLIHVIEASAENVELTMTIRKSTGSFDEYGKITAEFKGNVRYHMPAGLGIEALDYEGPKLTVTYTIYEPSPPTS